MTKKKIQYNNYLKSSAWTHLKREYDSFFYAEGDHCLFCYQTEKIEYHHWKYPKNLLDDSFINLIKCCRWCHEMMHTHNPELPWNDQSSTLDNRDRYILTIRFNMGQPKGSSFKYHHLLKFKKQMREEYYNATS